jgi:hypothetical protein
VSNDARRRKDQRISITLKANWNKAARLPAAFFLACRVHGIKPSPFLLLVDTAAQALFLFEREVVPYPGDAWHGNKNGENHRSVLPTYGLRQRYVMSSSRSGVGQRAGSHQTPLGLHRVAEKVGGGQPIGTTFTNRKAVGLTWQGRPTAPIAHRILWLEGLEPGLNRGGNVDTHARFVYVHGVGDEMRLGRPASKGCIHLAATDLLPLYDLLPVGTLVWVTNELFTPGGGFGIGCGP